MVIITSPKPHSDWYPHLVNVDGDINQLTRRINENPLGGEFRIGQREGGVGRTALLEKIDKLLVDPQYTPLIPVPQVVQNGTPGPDGYGGTTGDAPLADTSFATSQRTRVGTPGHSPYHSPIRGAFASGFVAPSPTQTRSRPYSPILHNFRMPDRRTGLLDDSFDLGEWLLDQDADYINRIVEI